MCGQFTNNGHMADNCPSMSGLRQDRHNIALQLPLTLMERHNGGRWETITADFGNKPTKSFTSPTLIHTPLDCHPTHSTHTPTRLVVADEGLSHETHTSCPAVFHEETRPSVLRPPAHKPDFIRLLEPGFVSHTNERRRYSSIKKIQIGEWKYCTDHNISHTAHMIRDKYTPLANVIRQRLPGTEVDILPVNMTRTGAPHTSTIASPISLLTLRTDPPDKLISKTGLDTERILAQLHLHSVQWLHHLLPIYRIKSRTITRRTFPSRTHICP
jgi:hypothetical protein